MCKFVSFRRLNYISRHCTYSWSLNSFSNVKFHLEQVELSALNCGLALNSWSFKCHLSANVKMDFWWSPESPEIICQCKMHYIFFFIMRSPVCQFHDFSSWCVQNIYIILLKCKGQLYEVPIKWITLSTAPSHLFCYFCWQC